MYTTTKKKKKKKKNATLAVQNDNSIPWNAGSIESDLVEWELLTKKQRDFRPQLVGNNSLFVTGASITSDYHDTQRIWLQVYALGERAWHQRPESQPKCEFSESSQFYNLTFEELPLASWKQAEQMTLYCAIGGDDNNSTTKSNRKATKMKLIPTRAATSGNQVELFQVWRCPLDEILLDMDMKRLRQVNTPELAVHIQVWRYSNKKIPVGGTRKKTKLVNLYLPTHEPNIGMNAIRSKSPKPFLQQRHNITLCVSGIFENGVAMLPEWLTYHLHVLGIDHVHMGVSASADSQLTKYLTYFLSPYIDQGLVTVSSTWDAFDKENGIGLDKCHNPRGAYSAMVQGPFYQDCLYRAKSTSEYIATWDLDEYMVLKNHYSSMPLIDMIQSLKNDNCPDWCFVTAHSHFAVPKGNYRSNKQSKLNFVDFPLRENEPPGANWRKSITRTKNAFMNAPHVPGSCRIPGTSELRTMEPNSGNPFYYHNCSFSIDNQAVMIHFRAAFSRGSTSKTPPVKNEVATRIHTFLEASTSGH